MPQWSLGTYPARSRCRFCGHLLPAWLPVAQRPETAMLLHHLGVMHPREAGVGKTRLFYEFTHSHRTQGWLVLESSATSYGQATSYLPVIDLLKAYFQIEDRDDGRRVREKLTGRLLTLDPALGPTLPAFLALLEVSGEDAAWQALDPSQRR